MKKWVVRFKKYDGGRYREALVTVEADTELEAVTLAQKQPGYRGALRVTDVTEATRSTP